MFLLAGSGPFSVINPCLWAIRNAVLSVITLALSVINPCLWAIRNRKAGERAGFLV